MLLSMLRGSARHMLSSLEVKTERKQCDDERMKIFGLHQRDNFEG